MTQKLEKAQAVLEKFRQQENMNAADWKTIIAVILPRYKADEAVSKCQTVVKIKDKLEELEKAKGKTWAAFMADELSKSRVELPPLEENMENIEADAAALDLEDQDGDGDASLTGPVDK